VNRHIPNVIPAKARIVLTFCAVGLLIYMCAGLATGYTYLPGRRGGILLSGIPTLFIVAAASSLFLAALLTIVDHYDTRPNEAAYAVTRKTYLRAALYLFIAAPFAELAHRLLLDSGIDVLPNVRGLAENYTFYSPRLHALKRYLDPITSNVIWIGLLSFGTSGIGILVDKYSRSAGLRRIGLLLISVSMLGVSLFAMAGGAEDFLDGEVKGGSRTNPYTIQAEQEPAKFNAILLAHFALSGILFTASAFVLVGVITNRIKTPARMPKLSEIARRPNLVVTGTRLPKPRRPAPYKPGHANLLPFGYHTHLYGSTWRPNQIPKRERNIKIGLSLFLLAYGGLGVAFDDLFVPGRRTRGAHFHGQEAWLMYGAMICAALVLLSVVVDHYDRRNNEGQYRTFARIFQILGWTLFATALMVKLFWPARD